jgi:hypothetical protein
MENPQPPVATTGKRRLKKGWKVSLILICLIIISLLITSIALSLKEKNTGQESGVSPPQEKGSLESKVPPSLETIHSSGEGSRLPTESEMSAEITAGLPQVSLKIIKTGKLILDVERGAYNQTRDEIYLLTESMGGYIQSESNSKQGDTTRGSILLRIPQEKFDATFKELSHLGDANNMEVSTQDVTEEYIDLEGRLRHLEAEESFYLGLIAQAKTIQEMISIREHLSSIQLEKERVLGRKNYLDNRISYSLIHILLQEKEGDSDSGKFWSRVKDAFKSFERAARGFFIGLLYALPYILIVLVLAAITWLFMKRHGRKAKGGQV